MDILDEILGTAEAERPESVRIALYYPYPFIRDDNWLKSAALFWDRVVQIRPPGFQFMVDADGTVHFEPSETARIFEDELQFTSDLPERHFSQFSDIAATAASHLYCIMICFPEFFESPGADTEFSFAQAPPVYFSWGPLEGIKTARIPSLEDIDAYVTSADGSIRFKERPGQVYMALLAQELSCLLRAPIVTDEVSHHQLLHDGIPRYDSGTLSNEMTVCHLTFAALGLRDFSNVRPEQIVEIREKYDGERREYVDSIQKACRDLNLDEFRSSTQMIAYLQDQSFKLQKKREEYERAIKGLKVETSLDSTKVSLSIPVVTYIEKFLPLNEPIAVASAGLLGIAAVLFKKHKRVEALRTSNPVGFYLHQVGKDLAAPTCKWLRDLLSRRPFYR